MTADLIRVTDETSRDDLAEALANLVAYAKRQQYILGDAEHPSRWDRSHQRIDQLLTEYEAAR